MRTSPRPLPALHAPFNSSHPSPAVPVRSRNIKDVAYDPASLSLQVTFHSGSVYTYSHVPPIVHTALMAARSKSSYLRDAIAPRFIATKRAPEVHP